MSSRKSSSKKKGSIKKQLKRHKDTIYKDLLQAKPLGARAENAKKLLNKFVYDPDFYNKISPKVATMKYDIQFTATPEVYELRREIYKAIIIRYNYESEELQKQKLSNLTNKAMLSWINLMNEFTGAWIIDEDEWNNSTKSKKIRYFEGLRHWIHGGGFSLNVPTVIAEFLGWGDYEGYSLDKSNEIMIKYFQELNTLLK
jgi:hypothetical protein